MKRILFFRTPEEFLRYEKRISPLVFTNGCFDILHVGHARYLKASRELGNYLVIGINSDASVKRLKGPTRPINSEDLRAEMLLALTCVDAVIQFDEDTPKSLIEKIRPDIMTKGGDYEKSSIVGAQFVESIGGKVIVLPFENGHSTTNILNKMGG